MEVRTAGPDDRPAVATVLDAAMLETDDLAARIDAGDVFVAVAVRRRRRGQGIGTALVEAALDRGRVTAAFDADLCDFYSALGFTVEPSGGGRFRGVAGGGG